MILVYQRGTNAPSVLVPIEPDQSIPKES